MPSPRAVPARCFALTVLLLAASSCAAIRSDGDFIRERGDGDAVMLTIDNRNFNDATIYARWQSAPRVRIGRVTGLTRETFEIEWRGNELRVEADFLAGGSHLSDRISVSRGDRLELTLRP